MSEKLAGFIAAGAAMGLCLAMAPPAFAGDGNSLSVLQNGNGNSLSADQSNAFGSSLGGSLGVGSLQPLTQFGNGNSATITVTGGPASGGLSPAIGSAFLRQGSAGTSSDGNKATIDILGASTGTVIQNGNQNTAHLKVEGGATGTIAQTGVGNFAGLYVKGAGTTVLYQQNGSGLSTGNMGPVTITSSGPSPGLTITQTSSGIMGMP